MPKRKAPTKISGLSGLVGSDDEDIMAIAGESAPPAPEPRDEPPSKKRRGRPRTSNEITAESKTAAQSKTQEPAQPPQEEEAAAKKTSRRGRPRGSSHTSESAAAPARASVAKEEIGAQETQEEGNEEPATAPDVKTTRSTRGGRSAATRGRGRGRGRATSIVRPSVTDGDFEYTPTRAQHQQEAEIPDTQMRDAPPTEAEVEESILPDPQTIGKYVQSSITKNAKSRVAAMRNSQDLSLRKRKSSVTAEQGGDPELRRRIGDLTRKNDTLESKYRDLREIGVEEAKANMDKLRKQCESITIGMSFSSAPTFITPGPTHLTLSQHPTNLFPLSNPNWRLRRHWGNKVEASKSN